MTATADYPVTTAVRVLRDRQIPFVPHLYEFEEHGGTRHSAASLGVPEHEVVKTLVLVTSEKKPLLVLMHGDKEVSTKSLARFLGVKSVTPCDPAAALRHTGYQFGGTSPFGTRTPLPVYAERTILALTRIYLNGGKRGFLVELDPNDLERAFPVTLVDVGIDPSR